MPGLREMLSRFRAVGAPGAPTGIGVPVDRHTDAANELRPVFDALTWVEAYCTTLRVQSSAWQRQRIREALEHAEASVTAAHGAAAGERAAAAAARRRQSAAELARIESIAERQAEEFTERARDRIPQLLPDVVRRVRDDIAALDAGSAPRYRP